MKKFKAVSNKLDTKKLEKKVQKFWKEENVFEKTLTKSKNFCFYDGPPFATGTPHYGHLLAGVLKDVFPRYKTMKGFNVPRQFGWDCHGLPVEALVQKKLDLRSDEVLSFGLDNFNQECKKTVKKYSKEWKPMVERSGRWVDMENSYMTMDLSYMESVWWAFKTLFNKSLVYEDYKVVPYSPELESVLSNFEANQNYKEVDDLSVVVKFKTEQDFYLLSWTTTPWTLPMNQALAVNKNLNYSLVEFDEEVFCLVQNKVEELFKGKDYKELKTLKGEELQGLSYTPLFSYVDQDFKVTHADFVDDKMGTGCVHVAPSFGENDYLLGKDLRLPFFCPVDERGVYTKEVSLFKGNKVLESNELVVQYLKDKKLLFSKNSFRHKYPFCYRTQKKLMYKAVSSWFVKVEELKDKMLENNQTVNWHPSHLKDGRFGNWLKDARDWAVSRNRYFGTPLPLWTNPEGEVLCVGSKKELEELSGEKVEDLHPEFLVNLKLKSPTGKSDLVWVGSVLDCWFESAAMPFARLGYPYKEGSEKEFDKTFPADFVAEGLDQTRGWFYTMMVLSTALFDKAPYKNVLTNGLVLAEDGKKMSKSLENYPDPNLLLDEYGADALRLYLLESGATQGLPLKFSEKGVAEHYRRNLLRLYNVLSFFLSYAEVDNYFPKKDFHQSEELLDKWLLSRVNSLSKDMSCHLEKYQVSDAVKELSKFVDDLSTVYLRLKRSVFQKEGLTLEKMESYNTMYFSLLTLTKLMAPLTPFFSEMMYSLLQGKKESVHLEVWPKGEGFQDKKLESMMEDFKDFLTKGRLYREKRKLSLKVPLLDLTLVSEDQEKLFLLKEMEEFVKKELNVREVFYQDKEDEYLVCKAKLNFANAGQNFGKKVPLLVKELNKLNQQEVKELSKKEEFYLLDEKLTKEDLLFSKEKKMKSDELLVGAEVSLVFNPKVEKDQLDEADFRELLRFLQDLRREMNLKLNQRVSLWLKTDDSFLRVLKKFEDKLKGDLLVDDLHFNENVKYNKKEEKLGVEVYLQV